MNIIIYNEYFKNIKSRNMGIGDWGLGIGDCGDWAQSPIPNPQSPIPNPQSPSVDKLTSFKKIYL